jgi:hypothetical protein
MKTGSPLNEFRLKTCSAPANFALSSLAEHWSGKIEESGAESIRAGR